jgi:TatD DNase family protein
MEEAPAMTVPSGYLDSHLHLQAQSLVLTMDSILERGEVAGVARMFCNATREEDWQGVINLAGMGKEAGRLAIVPFLGIHPWFVEGAKAGWEERLLARLQGVPAGIGEIGLDKSCRADFDRQRQVFVAQLQIASALKRPVAIHCVKAWGPLLEILEQFAQEKQLPAIMIHAYGGSTETLQRLIRLGCFISFSCRLIADRKRHPAFLATPLTHLLLETDSQGGLSVAGAMDGAAANAIDEAGGTKRGSEQARKVLPIDIENPETSCSEPADIPGLYAWAAAMRGMEQQELRQRIWKNGEIFTDTLLPR